LSLQDWRDIVIIVAGSLSVLVLLALFIFTVVLGVAARSVLSSVQNILKGEVTPLLDSARRTLQTVQGTTAFVGETAVSPIIRIYGIIAAIRRAFAVLVGLVGGRGRKPE